MSNITKENFKEFYKEIKPLIGGSSTGVDNNPIGTIIAIMSNSAPDGYLICDGTEYNIDDYKTLSSHFKEEFGASNYFGGDGVNTFCVPDLQGEFLRGSGTNSHTNQGSGGTVGEHQDGSLHFTSNTGSSYILGLQTGVTSFNKDSETSEKFSTFGFSASNTGGNNSLYTSRPTNTSVLFCICAYELSKESDNSDLPILYDEMENEQIIGYYRNSEGKKKPVYSKYLILQSSIVVTNEWINICELDDVEKLLNANTYEFSSNQLQNLEFKRYYNGYIQGLAPNGLAHGIDAILIEYTKISDEWE